MADMAQAKKKIRFIWEDDERQIHVNITLPRDAVDNFFKQEPLEFTFQKDAARIAVKQARKSLIL